MGLPPRDDPDRPLFIAVRAQRLLGSLMIVAGGFWLVPMLLFDPTKHPSAAMFQLRTAMVPLAPGLAYVLLAIALQRRQFWAAVSAIVLAGIQGGFTLFLAVSLSIALARENVGSQWLFALAALLLLVATCGQLIFFIAKSLPAIRNPPIAQTPGFETIETP